MIRAGDPAPKLTFTKVMAAPLGATDWHHENFLGQTTVVVFFSNVSDATAAFASRWNDSVEPFVNRPVQFVLIARDEKQRLQQWLSEHPLKGWVILDSSWETAQAWGIQMPQTVFVSDDTRVLGFVPSTLPPGSQVDAVLVGHPDKIFFHERSLPEGYKPDIAPSHTVHISATRLENGNSSSRGPDHWTVLGFELKKAIAKLYEIDETRIDFPAALDNGERYDFELLMPGEEGNEVMRRLIHDAIERYFGLTITHEVRQVDVYVMTAPHGPGPGLHDAGLSAGMSWTSSSSPIFWNPKNGVPTMEDLRKITFIQNMSGSGTNITTMCAMFEKCLDRLVVDESGLAGNYDFQLETSGDSRHLLPILHDELGLVATPSQRDVTILSVRQTRNL